MRSSVILRRSSLMAAALALCHSLAGAATVTWQGGNANWTNGLFWTGDSAPDHFSNDVFIDGGKPGFSTVELTTTVSIASLGISSNDWLAITGNGRLYSYGSTLVNAGSLSLSGSNSRALALWSLGAPTTLSGAGETVLANAFAHIAGSNALTIASGHLLSGGGQLGSLDYGKLLSAVNQGLIRANHADGMQVNLFGTLDNSAGQIEVATSLQLGNGTISGGTITGSGGAQLRGTTFSTFRDLTLAGRFSLHGSTYQDITLNDARLLPGGRIRSAGSLVNTGSLSLDGSAAGRAELWLAADTTLSGSGRTVLNSTHDHILGDHILTIAAGHTLEGGGNLGSSVSRLNGVVNQGLIAVSGSAGMRTQVGSLDNSAGTITVAEGSSFTLSSGILDGGLIQGGGSTAKLHGGGSFRGVTLAGAMSLVSGSYTNTLLTGDYSVPAGSVIGLAGTMSNIGSLNLPGSASELTVIELLANTTLGGTGRTVLAGAQDVILGHHVLTIAPEHTISGSGGIGYSSSGGLRGVINRGLIEASGSDGMLIYINTTFDNTRGRISIADGSFLHHHYGSFSGGLIEGSGSAALRGGGYFHDLSLAGSLAINAGSQIRMAGVLHNTGTLTLTSASPFTPANLALTGPTELTGSGTTRLAGPYSSIVGNHPLSIGTGHTVRGIGVYTLTSLTNSGHILAEGGTLNLKVPEIENRGQLQVASGATLATGPGQHISQTTDEASTVVNGTLSLDTFFLRAGALSGQGSIVGRVQNDGGVLSPGGNPGSMTLMAAGGGAAAAAGPVGSLGLTGTLSLNDGGLLRIDVNHLDDSNGHDLLQITGSTTLGGSVLFDFGSFSPAVGQSFVFMSHTGSSGGTFADVGATGGYDVTVSYEPHLVRATITAAVPESSSLLMALSGLLVLGGLVRRRSH